MTTPAPPKHVRVADPPTREGLPERPIHRIVLPDAPLLPLPGTTRLSQSRTPRNTSFHKRLLRPADVTVFPTGRTSSAHDTPQPAALSRIHQAVSPSRIGKAQVVLSGYSAAARTPESGPRRYPHSCTPLATLAGSWAT